MNDTNPRPLSYPEWREIMTLPEVQESWGLEPDATPEQFASMAYAAKFNFESGHPGYVGELFILQGDTLTGDAPFVLNRAKGGHLQFVN